MSLTVNAQQFAAEIAAMREDVLKSRGKISDEMYFARLARLEYLETGAAYMLNLEKQVNHLYQNRDRYEPEPHDGMTLADAILVFQCTHLVQLAAGNRPDKVECIKAILSNPAIANSDNPTVMQIVNQVRERIGF